MTTLTTILNNCRINYGSNGISDEYEEQLKAAIHSYIETEIIGADAKQVWDEEAMFCETCAFQPTDTTLNCICIFNNKLKAKQRSRLHTDREQQ